TCVASSGGGNVRWRGYPASGGVPAGLWGPFGAGVASTILKLRSGAVAMKLGNRQLPAGDHGADIALWSRLEFPSASRAAKALGLPMTEVLNDGLITTHSGCRRRRELLFAAPAIASLVAHVRTPRYQ